MQNRNPGLEPNLRAEVADRSASPCVIKTMGHVQAKGAKNEFTGEDALVEAVARNVPVEIMKADAMSDAPPARGRLLELRDECVVIEQVHVIGRDVAFVPGSIVECFFSSNSQLFQFRAQVLESGLPFRLNDQVIVPGMQVSRPAEVAMGQRRRVFRVPLTMREEGMKVEVWFARTAEGAFKRCVAEARALAAQIPPGQTPPTIPHSPLLTLTSVPPDFVGMATDASDCGLGVTLERCIYSRFKQYEEIFVRVALEDGGPPVVFRAEVRHRREVREHVARLGLMLREVAADDPLFHRERRRLVNFLQAAQRSVRR